MRMRTTAAAVFAGAALLASAGVATADTGPSAAAANSPGVLSGNTIQVPVLIDLNLCGNTIDVIGLLNPTSGHECRQK